MTSALPFASIEPGKEGSDRVYVYPGRAIARTLHCFRGENGQRHMQAILEVEHQHRMPTRTPTRNDLVAQLDSASPGFAHADLAPSKTFCDRSVLCLDGAYKKGPRSKSTGFKKKYMR